MKMKVENMRYIVFLIDSKDKQHDGCLFASIQEARDYVKESLQKDRSGFRYADKAVVGLMVWDGCKTTSIAEVETIGFKGDTKVAKLLAPSQGSLF